MSQSININKLKSVSYWKIVHSNRVEKATHCITLSDNLTCYSESCSVTASTDSYRGNRERKGLRDPTSLWDVGPQAPFTTVLGHDTSLRNGEPSMVAYE